MYASRLKEVFEIRTVIHCVLVHIRSMVVLFKTTGQLRELGDSMDFPEVRKSNFGSPGTTIIEKKKSASSKLRRVQHESKGRGIIYS